MAFSSTARLFKVIAVYVVGSYGLESLWMRVGHFGHLWDAPDWLTMFFVGVFVPLLLGLECANITRPYRWRWVPGVAIAPFLAVGLRLWADDVSATWLAGEWGQLVLLSVASAAVAVLGGIVRVRASGRTSGADQLGVDVQTKPQEP